MSIIYLIFYYQSYLNFYFHSILSSHSYLSYYLLSIIYPFIYIMNFYRLIANLIVNFISIMDLYLS